MLTISYSGSAYPISPNGVFAFEIPIQRNLTAGEQQLRFSHVDVQLYCTHLMLEILVHRYATELYYRFQC